MRGLSARPALWAVLSLALGLRVWGIGFGPIHADEPIVVNHALAYGLGDLNPHFFKIPPLVSYLLFAVYGIWYAAGRVLGSFDNTVQFQDLFIRNPEYFFIVARTVFGALLGTFTVGAVYAGMRRFFSERAAVLSALFLAVNFLHARDSHYIYVDIAMTLAVWWAVLKAMDVLRDGTIANDLLAGAGIGAAAAIKYNGALVCVALVAAHLVSRPKRWSGLFAAAAVSIAVFAALNPFAVLDARSFWAELSHQAGAEGAVGLLHHLVYSIYQSVGPAGLVLFALGAVRLLVSDLRSALVFFAFPLFFFVTLGFFSQPHERYALPLMPFLCAGAAIGSDRLLEFLRGRPARFAAFLLIVGAVLYPGLKTVQADLLFLERDTAALTRDWIEARLPQGTSVAFDHTSQRPPLARSSAQWRKMLQREHSDPRISRKLAAQAAAASLSPRSFDLYFLSESTKHPFSSVWPLAPFDAEALRREGVRYVVVHYEIDPQQEAFMQALKISEPLVRISPYMDRRRDRPTDRYAVTAAPYASEELFSRDRLGPVFEVYAL
jgi:hypothetical protein